LEIVKRSRVAVVDSEVSRKTAEMHGFEYEGALKVLVRAVFAGFC
jgi:hypothetical protein